MKLVYSAVMGLSLVALACAPALAGDQKSKTSDTQQLPKSERPAAAEPKTDTSPSASPATQGTTDSKVKPSMKSDQPAASPSTSDQKGKDAPGASGKTENEDKPKY